MKVPAMSKVPDLQIEVQETLRRIIVKMPGTAYETRFGLIPRGLCFLSGFGQDDRKARVTSQEFTLMAKAAATEKARELGWLIDEKRRRGWTDREPTRRRVRVPNRRLGTPVHRQDDWIGCSSSLLLVPPTAPLADFCW